MDSLEKSRAQRGTFCNKEGVNTVINNGQFVSPTLGSPTHLSVQSLSKILQLYPILMTCFRYNFSDFYAKRLKSKSHKIIS